MEESQRSRGYLIALGTFGIWWTYDTYFNAPSSGWRISALIVRKLSEIFGNHVAALFPLSLTVAMFYLAFSKQKSKAQKERAN
jgi:hypothetical protein